MSRGGEFPTCLGLFLKGSCDTNEPFDKADQNLYSDPSAKDESKQGESNIISASHMHVEGSTPSWIPQTKFCSETLLTLEMVTPLFSVHTRVFCC